MSTPVPRTCSTCAHRDGATITWGKCAASGFFIETERKFPTVCSKDFRAWSPRQGLLTRIKQFFVGVGKEGGCIVNTQQPEALRLADCIDPPQIFVSPKMRAAAELRRLHQVNSDLLEALNTWLEQYGDEEYEDYPEVVKTRAAIAKETGAA
jgi:hypothetical protein